MKDIIRIALALCLLFAVPTGMSQQNDSKGVVDLLIDVSGSSNSTNGQSAVEMDNIKNLYNALITNSTPSTMFLTEEITSSPTALYLTQIGLYGDIEFAIAGNRSDERLSTMPYSKQLTLLQDSKKYASTAHVCGRNEKPITGFKPQSFDQNEDTYKALDAMGIQYDAGFQAGTLYVPGHEKDVWPYPVEGHKFYAVPVSTYTLSGKRVVLQDSYFKNNGLSADQWYEALVAKFKETRGNDEPLVISLSTSISGSKDYLAALKKFIRYAGSENATFVNTTQLVDMARAKTNNLSAITVKPAVTGCRACDQSKSNAASNATITISLSMNNTTQVAAANNSMASK